MTSASPALDLENDQEELGSDRQLTLTIAAHDQHPRHRVVGKIDQDQKHDRRQHGKREQPDRDLGRPDLGEPVARQHQDARPERGHSAGVGAVVVLID